MKFRTELKVKPLERPIRYNEPIFAIGSCFTDEVGARLKGDKFRITHNPLGTLFNPLSIYGLLGRALHDVVFTPNEVQRHPTGECFLYGLPTRFTCADENALLQEANEALYQTKLRFHEADHVLVTFGTAWLYRIGSEVVANCHKQPHDRFERKLATLHEITQRWSLMLQRHPEKQFIFTVSPIRHLGEGAEGNAVSKATLRLAVEELCSQYPNAHYFPAYELLLDDLRDYRFYADDLCHPSAQAVSYIYEKFAEAAFDAETRNTISRLRALTSFAAHHPFNPASEQYRGECRRMIERMEEEQAQNNLDFSAEIALLKGRV